MTLTTLLLIGLGISIAFHFIGVYAGAKKIVWVAIALLWAGAIGIARSEISDKGYQALDKIRGKYDATDALIRAAEPEVSLYEMMSIKKSFVEQKRKATK